MNKNTYFKLLITLSIFAVSISNAYFMQKYSNIEINVPSQLFLLVISSFIPILIFGLIPLALTYKKAKSKNLDVNVAIFFAAIFSYLALLAYNFKLNNPKHISFEKRKKWHYIIIIILLIYITIYLISIFSFIPVVYNYPGMYDF